MASSSCSDSGIPPSASTLSQESIQEPDHSTISSSDEDTGDSHCQVRSILDILKSPQPSTLARKRFIRSNPPVGAKKSKGIALKSDPKSVSPLDRVKGFPDECLMVNFNQIFFL